MADTKNKFHDYDDIICLPHHTSSVHPRMSAKERAAQFAPFAALTGHGKRIRETALMAEEKVEEEQNGKISPEEMNLPD